MWSVLRAGYVGDAVLIGEPTGLRLGYAATGVVWARLSARGQPGHAMLAGGDGPFDHLGHAVAALRTVESSINEPVVDPIFAAVRERPYGMTIGRIEGGVWTASTPVRALRLHPLRFRSRPRAGRGAARGCVRRSRAPPTEVEIEFEAFRARAHATPTDGPLAETLSSAHRACRLATSRPWRRRARTTAATSRCPCLAYGPSAGNLHGTDEWVDLETLGADGGHRGADDRRLDGVSTGVGNAWLGAGRGRGSGEGGPGMSQAAAIRAATDVGGTFTDLVYFSIDPATGRQEIRHREVRHHAARLRAGRDERARTRARSRLAESRASSPTARPLVINALTERKGREDGADHDRRAFATRSRSRRGNRPDFFNLHYVKPPPFVPRYLRREVPGRMSHNGERADAARPLRSARDPRRLPGRRASRRSRSACSTPTPTRARAGGARARARAVAGALGRRLAPDHPRVARVRADEHDRALRLRPAASPSSTSAGSPTSSSSAAFGGQLYVMQSNCGVDSVEKTSAIPITMVESGPASGFWAAAELGRLIGEPNVLALDIGGTTAKCSLIEDGHVRIISDYWIERSRLSAGYPIHGAGRRPGRDRQRRRQHRLGRRLRQASRRARRPPAPCPGRRRTGAAAPRRRPRTPTSPSAGSTPTTSAAERSTPTWRRSAARSTRSPRGSGSTRARRPAGSCGSRTTT